MTSTPHRDDAVDIIGDRTLVAVQAVNISRLSTHPVPIVPGTLLVVAGQGPKDSNGAGKSSFIASITALLGDEQWRFASGAQAVAELLFNAELAAQGDNHWASADHGYIVGVFADPRDEDVNDALTVWLRVNVDAPHLQLRWTRGIHMSTAASEAERVRLADDHWQQLPKSAGRRDFVAKDLGRVLYGNRVRCVSFLSTSVRSRVATNLLSQPLNEIGPERIFAAIAALTGLDRELEAERKARADEHAERTKAAEALDRLTEWEYDAGALLVTFDRRDRARAELATAVEHWRTRAAKLLVDGTEEDQRLQAELDEQQRLLAEASGNITTVNAQIAELGDDQLDRDLADARKALASVQQQITALGQEQAVTSSKLDELRIRINTLTEAGRDADGRDADAAERELADAEAVLAGAQEAVGGAKSELTAAEADLRAAETGRSAAPEQLAALAAAGIPAVGLLDALTLGPAERSLYEPAVWPYRDALVVAAADLDAAVAALSDHPGSVLVPSDESVAQDTPLALPDLLAALGADVSAAQDPHRVVDRRTNIVVIGGFTDPMTGREARVRAGAARAEFAAAAVESANEEVRRATGLRTAAQRRLAAARSVEEAAALRESVDRLRQRLEEIADEELAFEPQRSSADKVFQELRTRVENRQLQIDLLTKERDRYAELRFQARKRAGELTDQRTALDLDARRTAWGSSEESAQERLLTLDPQQQAWDADAWSHASEGALTEALRAAFPQGVNDPDLPEQLRLDLTYRRDGEGTPAERQLRTFDRLSQGLGSYLRQQEEYERHQRQQIESQRTARRADFEAAQKGVAEAASAAQIGRATVTKAIRSRLQRVAEYFDELDRAYGGYGATLDYPTPEAPADPEQEWRWRAVPRWRRAEGHNPVSYNRRANTALMDEKAVKLVCAAALASAGGANLYLVLDELGRNLGKEHRREAVALFRQIGESHGITVVGALQDDMEPYAIDACGEYIKLRRSSDAMPYNEPPVVIGHDAHAERVRRLADAVTSSHNVALADS
ncbi:chromosome partitioning protein ParA [Actinopolymorpha alba]|uniref:chromosome partitioning protein ParA n=1 Tax=Actinopolymorpha alba TaxID=533267 RepID=UPI0003A76D9C|nr:chromosome partitioning protein ParA [Actinopolymorpha alba]